jgi:periplasmic copper chaperone A
MICPCFIGVHRRSSAVSRLLACLLSTVSLYAHAEVTVKDAWVRATVPAQTSTGAFMTLTSTEDAKVVAAKSPAAKTTEIHESMVMGGVNHMHEVEALELPAGKPVALKPGGHHVMLTGLARPLKAGERVPIAFVIEGRDGRRTTLEVSAEVRPIGSR